MAASPDVGRIYQINVSRGGVPKLPVARAGVTTYGIEFVEQDEKSTHFWGISFPSA